VIRVEHLSKNFGAIAAVEDVTAEIKDGSIFGLIGSNGAGKSTFMRLLCGIYKPDNGTVLIDGENVYENPKMKENIFYISDDQFFFHNSNMMEMGAYYKLLYPKFSVKLFTELCKSFQLDPKRKLSTFSKGMQKQAHIILALSCQTKYLLCDETFDGLDPVMRQNVKRLLADAVISRGLTPIIASHNLRELEDICDHVGLLHKGGIVFEREVDDLRLNIHKVQCAFTAPKTKADFAPLEIMSYQAIGSLSTLIVKGDRDATEHIVASMNPLYCEIVPLTLEEIFITEMEVLGYDKGKFVFEAEDQLEIL